MLLFDMFYNTIKAIAKIYSIAVNVVNNNSIDFKRNKYLGVCGGICTETSLDGWGLKHLVYCL